MDVPVKVEHATTRLEFLLATRVLADADTGFANPANMVRTDERVGAGDMQIEDQVWRTGAEGNPFRRLIAKDRRHEALG